MKDDSLLQQITLNPDVMAGKPVIRGTRLTVDHILNLLTHGQSLAEIVEHYDGVTVHDVRACLLFAARSLGNTDFLPLTLEGK